MEIREFRMREYAEVLDALGLEHWQEVGYLDKLDLNHDMYAAMQDAGGLHALGAFNGDELRGYCVFIVCPHTHNRNVTVAMNDALFLHPDERGKTTGARLIRAAETRAHELGAAKFLWHCPTGSELHHMLMRHHGYSEVDTVIGKDLT